MSKALLSGLVVFSCLALGAEETALKDKLVDLSGNTMKSKQITFFDSLMSVQ